MDTSVVRLSDLAPNADEETYLRVARAQVERTLAEVERERLELEARDTAEWDAYTQSEEYAERCRRNEAEWESWKQTPEGAETLRRWKWENEREGQRLEELRNDPAMIELRRRNAWAAEWRAQHPLPEAWETEASETWYAEHPDAWEWMPEPVAPGSPSTGTFTRALLPIPDAPANWEPEREVDVRELLAMWNADGQRSRLGRTVGELLSSMPEDIAWFVEDLLPRGWTLQVAGREKIAGKGTLVYYLLSRLERGEDTVFGSSGTATALIVTEEPEESIREKLEAFGLEDARIVMDYELVGLTWPEKVEAVVREAVEDGHGVLFADNISRLAGIEDEAGVELARAVEKLQTACKAEGISLIYDHHHKKGAGKIEDKGRGTTALPGSADVILDIVRIGGQDSRQRRVVVRGRIRAVNWSRVIELSADGNEYASGFEPEEEDGDAARLLMDQLALGKAVGAAGGPVDAETFGSQQGIKRTTASNRLNALVREGRAVKHTETKPYRFELAPVSFEKDE